jgi:Reverse transcriptase (RNA-dependent DNA polymerase)/Endonuclease-reverse transcriptase
MARGSRSVFGPILSFLVILLVNLLVKYSSASLSFTTNVHEVIKCEQFQENLLVVNKCSISSYTVCSAITFSNKRRYLALGSHAGRARRSRVPANNLGLATILALALCGDVELNPGPTISRPICLICDASGKRNQVCINCFYCGGMAHRTCASLSTSDYRKLIICNSKWSCWSCSMPSLSNSFFETNVDGNTSADYNNKPRRRGTLTCLSFNARSLSNKKKRPAIQAWLHSIEPAIIFSCETWLHPDISDAEVLPDGYIVFRKDRGASRPSTKCRGGGVLLAIRPELQPTRVTSLDSCNGEILWVEIKCGEHKVLLGSAYRAPNSPANSDLIASIKKAQGVQHEYKSIFLCGDFNLDIDWGKLDHAMPGNSYSDEFLSAFLGVVPHQMVMEATRITKSSRSTLDLVLTSNPSYMSDTEVIPGVSDHLAVRFNLLWQPPKPKIAVRSSLNYNKTNWSVLKRLLFTDMPTNTDNGDNSVTMEAVWENWKNAFWKCVDAAVPRVNIRGRRKSPWINKLTVRMLHKRDDLYRTWKTNQTDENWDKYRVARNTVKIETRRAHDQYIWKLGEGNGKNLWRYIHSKNGSAAPRHFLIDGSNEDNSQKIAESFAGNFNQHYTLPTNSSSDLCPPNFPRAHQSPTLKQIDIHPYLVIHAIKRLRPNGATGPDNIPCRILHECAKEIAPSLCHLFQTSMTLGTMPIDWKRANVVPVFKSGDRSNTSNYRPISLTSVVGKIMERVVNNQVLQHLHSIKAINTNQHGFLPRRSCVTMLTGAIDDWQHALDAEAGAHVDVISLDWAKAFDRVPHKRLLAKLKRYNISGHVYEWISSFLYGRSMRVVYDGAVSSDYNVLSGVPQGSVLGPLLFIIYMMDLPQCVGSSLRQYADDCTLYRVIRTSQDEQMLQADLDNIAMWCKVNYMEINESKSHHMAITKAKNIRKTLYSMNGKPIKQDNIMKILGITITQDLKWNVQTEIVRSKAAKLLGFLSRTLHSARPNAKRTIYLSLVKSVLMYGSPAWHPTSKSNIAKLEVIQSRATRFITNRGDCSRAERLAMCGISSLDNSYKESDVIFLKKMFMNAVDMDPLSRIQLRYRPARYGKGVGLSPPFARTTQYQNGFFCRAVKLFNSLEVEIRQQDNLNSFKNLVRHTFLDNDQTPN